MYLVFHRMPDATIDACHIWYYLQDHCNLKVDLHSTIACLSFCSQIQKYLSFLLDSSLGSPLRFFRPVGDRYIDMCLKNNHITQKICLYNISLNNYVSIFIVCLTTTWHCGLTYSNVFEERLSYTLLCHIHGFHRTIIAIPLYNWLAIRYCNRNWLILKISHCCCQ